MKNSKSRRDDGIKKSSGDDSQSDKPKKTSAESSFKSYRENRSKDALAKKGFVKKTLTRSPSTDSENSNSGNESADTSLRPKRVTGSNTGTFSRIGSGRPTSTFKGNNGVGSRNASGYKGPISNRESTSFRGKSDTRVERPSFGNRETTGFKGKSDSHAPITRGAERARAPRREATDRNDSPRDSRPFANRNTEENAAKRGNSPYKGSRAEKTYLDSKPGRSRSDDFDDEAETKPIKRNATTTHYNKVENRPSSFDKGSPKTKKYSKSAEGEFKERKPRAQSAESEFKERKPRAESSEGEFKERKPRAESSEGTFKERKPRAQSAESEFKERKPRAESSEGTFKERQKVRNQESSASAKEARPAKRLNADFDEYKNSSRVSTSTSRPFEKSAKPSKTAVRVDQAAERYSKGLAKPVMGTRLNKYIANSGLCARRKADEMIANGEIRVNGNEVTEMGYIVQPGDKVQFHDKVLKAEEMVYVLMNKPKDFITTTDDPQERRTVMELLNGATPHRIYPVGRLDRNTTGLLLFTNDGGLAEKLSHPSSNINKLYHVSLDKGLTKVDFDKITEGITLEDGLITVDELAFVDGMSKKEVGIRIHSGKNRIVRRIFESMGYDVLKLDRVIYAGLSKKDLTRGRWRHLSAKEIISLKHFTK